LKYGNKKDYIHRLVPIIIVVLLLSDVTTIIYKKIPVIGKYV